MLTWTVWCAEKLLGVLRCFAAWYGKRSLQSQPVVGVDESLAASTFSTWGDGRALSRALSWRSALSCFVCFVVHTPCWSSALDRTSGTLGNCVVANSLASDWFLGTDSGSLASCGRVWRWSVILRG